MDGDLKAILQRDPVRNANLLHFAGRYGIESFASIGDAVLERGTTGSTSPSPMKWRGGFS